MSATFVITGNVGNVTAVLRPSSDVKMTEDSTSDGFLHLRWTQLMGEQHARRLADFVALTVKIIGSAEPAKIGNGFRCPIRGCVPFYALCLQSSI